MKHQNKPCRKTTPYGYPKVLVLNFIEKLLKMHYNLFKEVYAHLGDFYLSGIRNRRVDSENRLTSAVDLGFHQVKELKEVPKSEVSLFLEHQRKLKAEVVKMLQTLNYEV